MSKYLEQLFSLESRIIVINNTSTFLGKTIVRGLTHSGAIVCGIKKPQELTIKSDKNEFCITRNQNNYLIFKSLWEELYEKHGKLNVLINIEEIETPLKNIDVDLSTVDNFRQALNAQLNTVVTAIQIGSQYIKQSGGGSIINIISIRNAMGFPDDLSYVATKNALLMTTKELAANLIKNNIRVNNIVIGYVQNTIHSNLNTYQIGDHRWKDLIGTIVYLASESSDSMTGQDIFIVGDRLLTNLSSG